jgi:integrase
VRGHIEHRGKDRWRILIDIGRDATGKRQRLSRSVHGTRKQAEAELARLLHEMATDTYVAANGMLVKEYLEKWLAHAKVNVAPQTYTRYAQIVTNELVPAFGTTKLADLSPLQIQSYLNRTLGRPRMNRAGEISAQTTAHFFHVLRRALNQAVRWGLLNRNPCSCVDSPKVQRAEMTALDETELLTLLVAIRGSRFYGPTLLAATTGLRRGEILGLRWCDLDLEHRECQITRSLQETPEGVSVRAPKTRKSRRMVLLPDVAIHMLEAHQTVQEAEGTLIGPGYNGDDLVFPKPDGSPWNPSQFSSDFSRLVRRHGLAVRFHDLRHTHASQLLKAGVPVKVVSERLGHATASITLDVYSHVLPGMQAEAVAKIDAALGPSLFS